MAPGASKRARRADIARRRQATRPGKGSVAEHAKAQVVRGAASFSARPLRIRPARARVARRGKLPRPRWMGEGGPGALKHPPPPISLSTEAGDGPTAGLSQRKCQQTVVRSARRPGRPRAARRPARGRCERRRGARGGRRVAPGGPGAFVRVGRRRSAPPADAVCVVGGRGPAPPLGGARQCLKCDVAGLCPA
jgi:hypothetical protein